MQRKTPGISSIGPQGQRDGSVLLLVMWQSPALEGDQGRWETIAPKQIAKTDAGKFVLNQKDFACGPSPGAILLLMAPWAHCSFLCVFSHL